MVLLKNVQEIIIQSKREKLKVSLSGIYLNQTEAVIMLKPVKGWSTFGIVIPSFV
jgi:hypothetical protein